MTEVTNPLPEREDVPDATSPEEVEHDTPHDDPDEKADNG